MLHCHRDRFSFCPFEKNDSKEPGWIEPGFVSNLIYNVAGYEIRYPRVPLYLYDHAISRARVELDRIVNKDSSFSTVDRF